jgi:hypothetical protein
MSKRLLAFLRLTIRTRQSAAMSRCAYRPPPPSSHLWLLPRSLINNPTPTSLFFLRTPPRSPPLPLGETRMLLWVSESEGRGDRKRRWSSDPTFRYRRRSTLPSSTGANLRHPPSPPTDSLSLASCIFVFL